jgi:eukaryotic-like serine/threonine-protein kinase
MSASQQDELLDKLLADYLERLDNGQQVDREAVIAAHPHLASELALFFEDWDCVSHAVQSLGNGGLSEEKIEPTGVPAKDAEPSGDHIEQVASPCCEVTLSELASYIDEVDEIWPHEVNESIAGLDAPPSLTQLLTRPDGKCPTIGRFRLRRILGWGGFGLVFLADDPSLRRCVALKIPRPELMFSKEVKQRFVREAQLAALLDHPGIVPVYETGEAAPLWYIASAYCNGPTLTAWLRRREVPAPPRLAAFIVASLSGAVYHAHSRGVLHRDLKPSNILLEPAEASFFPEFKYVLKVTDFGLAIARDQPHALTRAGALLGTSRYMAPEQAAGNAQAIGVTTDVYSLGVILYELLAGRPPFIGATDFDVLDSIQHDLPAEAPLRSRNVPRDLLAICLKCLNKDPRLRYPSAAELEVDLQRYLDGRPVTARPVGRFARSARWCKRYPSIAALLLGLLIVVVIGATGIIWQWRRAEANYAETRALLYAANIKLAEVAWDEGNIRAVHQLLEPFNEVAGRTDLRGWEWHYLHRLCHDALTVPGKGRVFSITENPIGHSIVVGTTVGNVWSFDPQTGTKRLDLMCTGPVIAAALSADEQHLAVLEERGVVEISTLAPSRRVTARFHLPCEVATGVFNASITRLAAAGRDNNVRLYDVSSRLEERVLEGHTAKITSACFSINESQLITSSQDGTVGIWDIETGQLVQRFEHPKQQWLLSAALSNDGTLLAAGGEDNTIIVWDVSSQRMMHQLAGHSDVIETLAFSPDNNRLASGSADRTIRVWEMPDGQLSRTLRGHLERVTQVAFRHKSPAIISGSADETVRLWDLNAGDFHTPPPRAVNVTSALFSEDGAQLACRFVDGSVVVFEVQTWEELLRFAGSSAGEPMAYDSRRNRIAVSADNGRIELWTDGSRSHQFAGHAAKIDCLALSSDGKWLASGGEDATLKLWDIETGAMKYDAGKQSRDVIAVAFSPDSKLLFSVADTDISVWDSDSGQLQRNFKEHPERVYNISFNHTGDLIATGDRSGTIIVWDPSTGKRRETLAGHTDRAYACCFTPDSRRLASCSRDGTVRWWDLTTSRELYVMKGDWGALEWITMSPDGWILAAINEARELRVWDPRP